jgi:hypothetical protein
MNIQLYGYINEETTDEIYISIGTCFSINKNQYILTTKHFVDLVCNSRIFCKSPSKDLQLELYVKVEWGDISLLKLKNDIYNFNLIERIDTLQTTVSHNMCYYCVINKTIVKLTYTSIFYKKMKKEKEYPLICYYRMTPMSDINIKDVIGLSGSPVYNYETKKMIGFICMINKNDIIILPSIYIKKMIIEMHTRHEKYNAYLPIECTIRNNSLILTKDVDTLQQNDIILQIGNKNVILENNLPVIYSNKLREKIFITSYIQLHYKVDDEINITINRENEKRQEKITVQQII